METVLSPLIACLGLIACVLVIYVFGRLLLEVVWRLFLAVALTILASLMLASSLFNGAEEGTAMGVICGFILLPFVLKAVWSLRGPLVHRAPFGGRCDALPAVASTPPETLEKDGAPQQADDFNDAWVQASTLTGETSLRDAQAACSVLLARAKLSETLDAGLIDAACFVRRQVPALVQETHAVCTLADEEDCTTAKQDLQVRLLEIGEMARKVLQGRSSSAQERVSLRHTHIANRLGTFE